MAEDHIVSSEVEEAIEEEQENLSFLRRNVQIRYVLALMGFFNFSLINMLRVSTSIALVAMVDWEKLQGKSDSSSNSTCSYSENSTRSSDEDGPYKWESPIQGHILAGYFYGLMATQILSINLAEKVSAKYILLIGTLMSAVGTLLIPLIQSSSGNAIILLQLLKGLGQGFIIPSFGILMLKWIPASERYFSMCMIGSGIPLGGFFGISIGGVICKAESLGWKYVFFIYAGITFIWCFFWIVLIFDSPLTHPYITKEELVRIMQSQTIVSVKDKVPYKNIFTSGPVWAFIGVGFASYWALAIYTTVLPLFMSTILKFDIEMNGLLSSLPFLFEMLFYILSCYIINILFKKYQNKHSRIYKISICIGLIGFAICMLIITFTACDRISTVILLVLGLAFCGMCFSLTNVIPQEMAPRYAGTVALIMNTFGALAGIIVPTMVGYLTMNNRTIDEWRILFYVTFCITILAAILFLIFGSSKLQEWNEPSARPVDEQELVMQVELTPEGQQRITMVPPATEPKTVVLREDN